MASPNTYTSISPRTIGRAVARLLKNAKAEMLIEDYGQIDPQGENKTLTRIYRRYLPFPVAIAPVAEGVTPTGDVIQYQDVSVTLSQYAGVCKFTDIVQDTHEDPILNGVIIPNQKDQIAETLETIRYNTLRAGTQVTYAPANVATSRATVNGTLGRGDLQKIVRHLKRNRARMVSKILRASARIATDPVLPAFAGLMHTDLESDLRKVSGFVDVAHYSDSDGSMRCEQGKVESIRFRTSDLFKPFLASGTSSTTWLSNGSAVTVAAAADVYPILIIGQDAYSIVPLSGTNAVTMYVENPRAQIGDEIAQNGFASWKTLQATVITTQSWMHRYEVACTANPAN